MRIQFNLPVWFLLVALAAVIVFRFSSNAKVHQTHLKRFAESHARRAQVLIMTKPFVDGDGQEKIAHLFAERPTIKSIGHQFLVVTDSSLLPLAWISHPYDCELQAFTVNKDHQLVVDRIYRSTQHLVTRYKVVGQRLESLDPALVITDGAAPPFFVRFADIVRYQKLGDRRDGEPVGRWGNR